MYLVSFTRVAFNVPIKSLRLASKDENKLYIPSLPQNSPLFYQPYIFMGRIWAPPPPPPPVLRELR